MKSKTQFRLVENKVVPLKTIIETTKQQVKSKHTILKVRKDILIVFSVLYFLEGILLGYIIWS